jgi:heavy metal sensor kinase
MFSRRLRKVFKTLRFRLASTFLLLLTLVLTLVGFEGTKTLQTILENQSEQALKEQLGAMRAYLRFDEKGTPLWFADPSDTDEEAIVGRLKSVFVEANDQGVAIDGSPDPVLKGLFNQNTILRELAEMQKTHEPVIKTFVGKDRIPYQVISAIMIDSERGRRQWYIAQGRSLAGDRAIVRRFTRNFCIFLPITLMVCMIVSWYSAGAALKALQAVEKAAQEITGSNLGLQIAKRGADDELDRLIDSFNQMSARLKESFEQIRQFSTDVSHELRTPLTAIQGQLEVALFTSSTKEHLQEAIENALQDVERLANLVRALLLLSQSESGQIPMHKTTLDLTELIEDLVDQFQIPAEAQNVKLEHNKSADPVFCECDRTQIERVVTNLLANAIKYTPAGGRVRAWAESAGSNAKLVVEDSGVGIPEDHLPHIFNRFYRVPDPNPEKGLGLGLSFVSAIVKAHGGEINVASHLGSGSRFEVVLPGNAPVRTPSELPTLQA